MQAHPTTGTESLLLRTPVADETGGGAVSPAMAKSKGQTLRLTGQIIDLVEPGRLPTPNTKATNRQNAEQRAKTGQVFLTNVVQSIIQNEEKMLPTLRASDGYERRNRKTMEKKVAEGGDVSMVTLAAVTTNWGKYESAIKRWENVLNREAPSPTLPDGRDGAQRLSAKFTEWMMGLDDGWITSPEIGLTRNEALKACGNGVVPQQAVLALTNLLKGVEL